MGRMTIWRPGERTRENEERAIIKRDDARE
jgi:hypothetical protein